MSRLDGRLSGCVSELTELIEALTTRREILVRRLQQAARVVETTPSDLPVPNDGGGADHLPGRRMPGLVFPSTDGRHERLGRLGPGTSIVYLYPLTGRPDVDLPEGRTPSRAHALHAADMRLP